MSCALTDVKVNSALRTWRGCAASNKRTAPPLIMDGFREGGELRGREEVEGADLFVPPTGKEGGILFAL